ncbi:transcriptional repressor [Nisaea acidiphila]|uniref:Ferric uptake regulation protein n=1 Tax=Nisaea acidiphila TaxID=1862145 RepID=A0A9J7ATZ7_9PROT|nr:Fur family transcriptional regulator [Nisaea acidiphila]UUX50832.1 transcriptional repressor [Nisaea acidiphila]
MSLANHTPKKRDTNDILTLRVLNRANGPLTAYQILDRLRSDGVSGPTTVYRALDRLIARGVVHRIESLNAYILCTCPTHSSPSVFAICEQCGAVSEYSDPTVEKRLREIAGDVGFDIRAGSVELKGSCIDCNEGARRKVLQ